MADIFISYSREDAERTDSIIKILEAEGFSIFYDIDVRAGERFDDALENQLSEAKCVLALWSKSSVQSRWVHAEAGGALRRSAVIPVYLDHVRPPRGFDHLHGIDLSDWDGSPYDPRLSDLVRAIHALLGHGREITQPTRRTDSIRDYSKSVATTGTRLIREIKVLFVGAGGAGKTSLIRQLFHRAPSGSWIKRLFSKPFNENEEQTQGIEIARLTHATNNGDIRVNFWDFGGQEIIIQLISSSCHKGAYMSCCSMAERGRTQNIGFR